MAKGDIMHKMQMGIQPGLTPLSASGTKLPTGEANAPVMSAVNPSEDMMGQLGVTPTENFLQESSMPPKNAQPMNSPSVAETINPRPMPMQSGGMFAQGKHAFGTPQKKMLKYNA